MQNSVGQTQPIQPQTVQVPNYSGVNIQIFNPAVNAPGSCAPTQPPCVVQNLPQTYPQNYYTQNYGPPQATANATATATVNPAPPTAPATPVNTTNTTNINNTTTTKEAPKTEKRDIVQLTDDYVRTLETYLNDKNQEIRLMGAKEVLARLQEDPVRKDDKALNALVNKMLQDPSAPIKFIAMSALSTRAASGDDLTVKLLQNIQQQQTGYGQDSLLASDILLKMSGKTVQKEFEVKNKDKSK